MFEPAGVRTLLGMRSSLPMRPATAKAKANELRENNAGASDASRNALMPESRRPMTAPPAASGLYTGSAETNDVIISGAGSAIVFSGEALPAMAEQHAEDAETDDEDDPENVISQASTLAYQLQHWQEERQIENERRWKELEEEYGFVPSVKFADVLANSDAK